jgi:hypothetical protein
MSTTLQTTTGFLRLTDRIGRLHVTRPFGAQARFLDRVDRIEQEVHDHLLHLDPVTIHSGQIGFEVELVLDLVNWCAIPKDDDHRADFAGDIQRLNGGSLLLEQGPQTPDRLASAGAIAAAEPAAPACDQKSTPNWNWN